MNKELFDSMQKQMTPSPEVRAALTEKLTQPVKKRPIPWKKYTALAACAALVVGAFTVYQAGKDRYYPLISKIPIHSYVTVEDLAGYIPENATTATGGSEGSDQDMGMTPEDLTAAMLDVGYTREEIEEYQSIGYQMTWAKWWKFVDGQKNSEGNDPFNLDSLKMFSQKELYVRTGALPAPNTGDLPGGAYVGDVPVQEGAEDYQKLMAHFNGAYPDWYGGAYLDESGRLVVQVVESEDPGDKSLELQVLDWTGSDTVMFSSCKYSLAQLSELMDRLNALPDSNPECGDVMAGWGINEEANRIELTLTQVNNSILVVLAKLDPEDDMILVQVGQRATADVGTESPAVSHVMPGGVTVPDDEDLIAVEPYYDGAKYDVEDLPEKLPEEKQPALTVDSIPEEDVSTSSWFPQE
ncbi:hypothetical protein [Flintibacter muris]|uniref:hypothetical protein n=1 Tax=Flintibacter muris TaxID=2941327 RepID=UPI00203DE7E1|nr:hypothetical protein [Flintibacter muris]